ncbi:PAS domain-containing sensor histidine kinase [Bradyrhizobium sp. CCGUVB1N3]|uniref:sensor histidine kinase n=1 Tax=Bradyrhizobium sp. CCGUVB1N3 TaxID=2949629 RepID=UPI0020B310B4|nr:PAS domain-containing sensor histidine kinase [Bradyrhizobium sp. CCGUVB1N3]MCP3473611.1 PAS domain-containing sensor histidine kinase [Bradyrhizobium sp. CCGUVB1N3]
MNSSDFQLQGVDDPRLAVHATSPLPAWLWSIDGKHVVWANPVGAKLFGAANATELAKKIFGPADPHRRQVAQLGRRLLPGGAVRLERLRGFGSTLGMLMTCACARLEFPDGSHGLLVAAMSSSGRVMPLVERLQRLVEGAGVPMAAFTPDGLFIGTSDTARVLLSIPHLAAAGLDAARSTALAQGRARTPLGIGHLVLQRVGVGADTGLVALYEPGAAEPAQEPRDIAPEPAPEAPAVEPVQTAAPMAPAVPDYEQPALVNEAPAEFALFDAFAEPLETAAVATPAPVEDAVDNPDNDIVSPKAAPISAAMDQPPPAADAPATPRNQPLRFLWQMDAVGRFVLGSDDFIRLMGTHTAAGFGRLWSEISAEFALDPEGRVARALATRDTWAGITVNWPVDGGERLPVELAGIPFYDRLRNFAGFKGFGVCRDLDGLNRLDALRRFELFTDPPAHTIEPVTEPELKAEPPPAVSDIPEPIAELPEPIIDAHSQQADLDRQVETPPNVVPFRPLGDNKLPTLTPVENSAFNELARQLSERLERERDAAAASIEPQETTQATIEEPPAPPAEERPRELAEWLVTEPEPPPRGEALRDRMLLDLVPTGILIYRLDRLLYANPAFLARVGHPSLGALEEAGGLDALYVAPGVSSESSTSEAGTPVTISATDGSDATDAHLHTIIWDGDTAHALICALPPAAPVVAHTVSAAAEPEPAFEDELEPKAGQEAGQEPGQANAEDLAAILDTTAEGIVMFDAEGNIHACNRSAEALFGYDGETLLQQNLTTLFAPESQRVVIDYLDSIRGDNIASLLDHGREVLGRESKGGVIPLAMIMGRTQPDGPNFFAVFRDLSQSKKGESELKQAQRLADGAANAKADMLARISHEIRTPLNAIIGFAEVMISERFGALGNERYGDYMKDIRASGERVIAIIDDLSELSRIETGKLDLTFGNLNLNDLVEACVVVMQPQANRERIIIRTSLAHALPQVSADARALRQITMNLIGNSIRLASAGGQVIVSSALTDGGEVALRIRDTGHGLSEKEVAAAMEPFRTPPPLDASESAGLSLSLIRALVEANRARFNIKTAANTGTLIEVVFAPSLARA